MKAAFPKALFKKYFDTLIADISILNNFEIANTNIWLLDWHAINNVKQISKGKMNWNSIPVFKSLHSFRKNPAIYFFTVNDSHNQILFSEFLKCKAGNQKSASHME